MSSTLEETIAKFSGIDESFRLELLLDYSKRLPALPVRLAAERDAGLNRVPECMSPVFLWIEEDGEHVHIFVDVAEEAPTVKGLLAIVVEAYDGRPWHEVCKVPLDLINRLGLSRQIRMNRAVGLAAIIERIRRGAQRMGVSHN